MSGALVLLLAVALDALVGDPDWLWRRVPHPVVALGALIERADRRLNREGDAPARRRALGTLVIAALVATSIALGLALIALFGALGPLGAAMEVVAVAVLLAGRSLHEHVAAVRDGLEEGVAEGRRAVSMIVGRDPERLDGSGVARAAIESLAENFSDGVVAPAFWFLVGGLPGLVAYKMVNTADSMIGHRSARHLDFGRAAARLDDALNWPPARLAALLIALAGPAFRRTILVDAPRHRSPNAGWPEAAMAAALGLALGGPRSYGEGVLDEPWLNAGGRREAGAADIEAALRVHARASLVQAGLVAALAFFSAMTPRDGLVQIGRRRHQLARDRVGGAAEHLGGGAALHDAALVHHRHVVRDGAHHGEVVADEQERHAQILAQQREQLQHARAHRHVERADRLVGDDQGGPGDDGARDGEALALASGELVRVAPRVVGGEIDPAQRLGHAAPRARRQAGGRAGAAARPPTSRPCGAGRASPPGPGTRSACGGGGGATPWPTARSAPCRPASPCPRSVVRA